MAIATMEKVITKKTYNPLRLKSYEEVLQDLAISRRQYELGQYEDAGAVVKEIRTRYGIS